MIHETPSVVDTMHQLLWCKPGPTASFEDVRIVWEDEAREAVVADAAHPVAYTQVACPDDPVTIETGDGWRAVVPADRAIESMVLLRGQVDRIPYDIRRPVELPIGVAFTHMWGNMYNG